MIIDIPPIQSDFDSYRKVNFGSGEKAIYRLWWFMVVYGGLWCCICLRETSSINHHPVAEASWTN
jgi:hypothetical protein